MGFNSSFKVKNNGSKWYCYLSLYMFFWGILLYFSLFVLYSFPPHYNSELLKLKTDRFWLVTLLGIPYWVWLIERHFSRDNNKQRNNLNYKYLPQSQLPIVLRKSYVSRLNKSIDVAKNFNHWFRDWNSKKWSMPKLI